MNRYHSTRDKRGHKPVYQRSFASDLEDMTSSRDWWRSYALRLAAAAEKLRAGSWGQRYIIDETVRVGVEENGLEAILGIARRGRRP